LHIIDNARIETAGKYQSCMVSKWLSAVIHMRAGKVLEEDAATIAAEGLVNGVVVQSL